MIEQVGAFIIFTIAFIGIGLGMVIRNKPVTGSCGGLNNALGDEGAPCKICGRTTGGCEAS
ncbi:MAG: hypothetical protein VW146_02760 [Gammaproteobacteria bacterium]